MDKLRACRRCGAVVTFNSPCECETGSADQMVPVQDRSEQPRNSRRRRAQPIPLSKSWAPFWWGFWLTIIGVIIVAVRRNDYPNNNNPTIDSLLGAGAGAITAIIIQIVCTPVLTRALA